MRALYVLPLLLCLAAPASAQTPPDPEALEALQAQEREAEAKQAEIEKNRAATQAEIDKLRTQLVDIGRKTRASEASVAELTRDLDTLREEKTALESMIFGDKAALSKMLAALQRIEHNPPPALLTRPGDAAQAAQAAAMLSTISKDLKTRAQTLALRLTALETVVTDMTVKLTALGESEAELAARQSEIAKLIREKERLAKRLSKDRDIAAARAAKLAAQSQDLRDLINRFENTHTEVPVQSAPPTASGIPVPRMKPRPGLPSQPFIPAVGVDRFAEARGAIQPPVEGTILHRYGAVVDGAKTKGLTLSTAPNAQVLAPFSGRIDFAGQFKGHGHVIILNVGEGYVLLLTGMGETYVKKGDMVLSGEPVGLMPFNTGRAVNAGPSFYIEIRKDKAPIDPKPWLGTAFAIQG